MKHFIIFKRNSEFLNQLSNIPEDAIVFIEDTSCIYTHGMYFYSSTEMTEEEINQICN